MRKLTLLFLATIFSIVAANAQGSRIFGYLPDYRDPNKIDFTRVTDIGFSFMNPDASGNIIKTSTGQAAFSWNAARFSQSLSLASANNVDVWIAVGGQDDAHAREKRLYDVSKNVTTRNRFAEQLLDYAHDKGCVGVIIDWEFPRNTVNANATTYHRNLLEKLQAYDTQQGYGLKIGIAVGGEYTQTVNHIQYVDQTLFTTNADLVDEWHIMAYDFPNVAAYDANHSSLKDGKASLDKWIQKGVPAGKSLLAVPFYARDAQRNAKAFSEFPDVAFDSDQIVSGGKTWYYNGEATIQAKTDHAISKGAAGMVIWDLGQDKTGAKSLLTALHTKLESLCPVPTPGLGPDLGVCDGQTVELNSGVDPSSNYTISWKKNGSTTPGSSNKLTVSEGGEYEVIISEVGGAGCSRNDVITVVSGASVTGNDWFGCRDQEVVMTINNPAAGKQYDWYDAAVGGSVKNTGTEFSFMPTNSQAGSTLKYYVEERSDQTENHTLLPSLPNDDYGWSGGNKVPTEPRTKGILVTLDKDATLKSVSVFTQAARDTKFTIKLLSSDDNTVLHETAQITSAGISGESWQYVQKDVTLDFTVSAGSYFLAIYPVAGQGDYVDWWTGEITNTTASGVATVADHAFTDWGGGFALSAQDDPNWDGNGVFFNLDIQVGASTSCGRALVEAEIDLCVGYEDLVEQNGVTVAPNPTSDAFTFSRGSLEGDVQVNVLTVSGDLLYSESVGASASFGSDFAAGVYVVQIVTNGDIVSTKVVKQ